VTFREDKKEEKGKKVEISKYGVNQRVWVLKYGEIYEGIVDSVYLVENQIRYLLRDDSTSYLLEDRLFESVGDLKAHLQKVIDENK